MAPVDGGKLDPDRDERRKVQFTSVDGGWAWAVMMACCLWNFIVAGTVKSFGVVYLEILYLYGESPAQTAMVGFTFGIVIAILSPASGYLSDHHPIQTWTFVCGIISGLAMAVSGLMPNLTSMVGVYGVICGMMGGMMDSPFLGMFSKYFYRKRSVANGVAFAGSSLGCLVLPLMLRWTVDNYTIRGAMFFMGGVWMHSCVVAAVMCPLPARDRMTLTWEISSADDTKENQQDGTLTERGGVESKGKDTEEENDVETQPADIDPSSCHILQNKSRSQGQTPSDRNGNVETRGLSVASVKNSSGCSKCLKNVWAVCTDYMGFLNNPELLRFTGVLVFSGFSYFGTLIFWPTYAEEIGLSKMDGSLLVSIAGITELIGRPFVGYLGGRFNKTLICLVTCALACLSGMLAYMVPNREILMGFCAVFGLVGGTPFVLGLPILSEAVDPHRIGSAAGLFPLALSLGSAVGSPILGYFKEVTGLYVNSLRLATMMYAPACLLLVWSLHCTQPVSKAGKHQAPGPGSHTV